MSANPPRSRRLLASAVLPLAVAASLAGADWPQFRGPGGNPSVEEPGLPLAWKDDGAASENIAWKAALPGRGVSGPIAIGERIFITANSGYRQDRLHVLAFDAASGRRLWERQFLATGLTQCHPKMSLAAPTPASDGRRVVAFFSSNDLACLDLDGNLLWLRGLTSDYPQASNSVGMSSSPLIIGDTVIVQVENDSDSFAAGIDIASGANRWKIPRPASVNWTSPIAVPAPGAAPPLALLQSPAGLSAHEALSGKLAWERPSSCGAIPSCTAAGGLIFAPVDGLVALAPGVGGEAPAERWASPRLRLTTPSAVVHRGLVYVLSGSILKAADAASGELRWQRRLQGDFSATPIAAAGRIYCFNEEGLCQVVAAGPEQEEGAGGKVMASSALGEGVLGTPAVAGKAIYVRGHRTLWKLAAP